MRSIVGIRDPRLEDGSETSSIMSAGIPGHRERVADDSLIDRVIMLRRALEGLSNDNAALRRQIARLRAEKRELQGTVDRAADGDGPDLLRKRQLTSVGPGG